MNVSNFITITVISSLAVSCAQLRPKQRVAKAAPRAASPILREKIAVAPPAPREVNNVRANIRRIESLTIDDVIKVEPSTSDKHDASRYDFPIIVNRKVEGWMDYFTGRGRRHFERYLGRSSRYIPLMRQILRKQGLPEDLVFLAMIESGFNMRAYSRAAAVGPWQFMRGTGTRYGLRVDEWIDERQDPIRATEAAARYLKDLYLMFESWYLAAAAYNAGEYKILRAVRALKTNNFWAIAKSKYIRRETKDYVPKLIAAAILAKNTKRYGFGEIDYQDPLDFETVEIKYPIRLSALARMINTSTSEVMALNPEIRRGMLPPGTKQYTLRVPVGTKALVASTLNIRKRELVSASRPRRYRVRRGDHLYGIAKRFGISINALTRANNMNRRTTLRIGKSLILPPHASPVRSQKRRARSRSRKKPFISHTVRRGESLWSIAEKYNTTVQQLFRWNRLKQSKIFPGKRLKVRPRVKDA